MEKQYPLPSTVNRINYRQFAPYFCRVHQGQTPIDLQIVPIQNRIVDECMVMMIDVSMHRIPAE